MQEPQLAELLAADLRNVVRDERVSAEVRVTPARAPSGPFVEVRPSVATGAPEMSIHVLSGNSVALTIGDSASADWEDDTDSVLETVRSLATAMFHGQLAEEVTRDRSGRVVASKLLITRGGERNVIWQRTSTAAQLGLRSKTREVKEFPGYPTAAE